MRISQSLNKAYRQLKVDTTDFEKFKNHLKNLYEQIPNGGSEETLKGDLMDFLKGSFYTPMYKIAPLESMDCVIHLGNNPETPVGVVFEVKRPESSEMISRGDLNNKAMQEVLLYYLRERVGKGNFQLKQLIVTNINEYFIFDAKEFERVFYSNKTLVKEFQQFVGGQLSSDKTDFFYKEIASKHIEAAKSGISFTYFDIRTYKKHLANGNDKKLIELFKIFSPVHLLKQQFQNDSNTLNKSFYTELLYIMGLEEVEDKERKKRIITRLDASRREPASIIENAITILDAEDRLLDLKNRSAYGKNKEEQLFNIALELSITWINRILFLKLLEAQMVKYHKGDKSYAFMGVDYIPDYDELNKLFFQVLAKRRADRRDTINAKYGKVPYLNSSLFEASKLEHDTIRISNLENIELPLYSGTVLKDGTKPRYKKLSTLEYMLRFLDAYDFASEGSEDIQDKPKTLINASVLGLIFEKLNGHKDGSVFTPGSVTMYMCREALRKVVVLKFNERYGWACESYEQLKDKEFTNIEDANQIINSLTICDPSVGSGHFLVAALNEIITIKYDLGLLLDCEGKRVKKMNYSIEVENDELIITDEDGEALNYIPGNKESQRIQETLFNEKRKIIENCLFGVDLNANAVNICRLRLWIELLKNSYYTAESDFTELETLPNIDINIKAGNSLLHRFDLKEDISHILKQTGITIEKYKSLVSEYKNARSKEAKHDLDKAIRRVKSNLKTEIGQHSYKNTHLQKLQKELNAIQDPKLFEDDAKVAKAQKKRAERLKAEIAKLEAFFDDIRTNKMYCGAFEWRIEFPEVLDNNGNFIGFDCIIGNPPYIQLQSMGEDSNVLETMNYQCYERKGDVYCLFYELGLSLLRPNYLLSFITSNKWMRTEYGESLRKFLATNSNPEVLIDFTGVKVFDAATVEVNILTLTKKENVGYTLSCAVNKNEFDITKLSDYVQRQSDVSAYMNSDSWVILSGIEKSIKTKIESIGTPLKDWDISINYGIKTGFNDAFIINNEKRNQILDACYSEEERSRTDAIIRPILRGRDVRRYGCDWSGLWIINTHNGIKGLKDRINIAEYPALKAHLDLYWDKISSRSDKGDTPYNLRNCAYLDDLSKPKIVWGNLNQRASYAMAGADLFINAPGTMIVPASNYLLGVLNSKLADFYIRTLGVARNGGYFEYKPMFISQLPVDKANASAFEDEFKSLIETHNESTIDSLVYDIFKLSDEERIFIEKNSIV